MKLTRPLLQMMPGLALLLTGCNDDAAQFEPTQKDFTEFINAANQSNCANINNRVFVIDDTLVFMEQIGNCPDLSPQRQLYKDDLSNLLCREFSSVSGPRRTCPNPAYAEMFNTLVTNYQAADLGLGPSFSIQRIK